MEILRSEKGKDIGHLNDFLYWKQSSKGAKAYWRCIFFQAGPDGEETTKCPAFIPSSNVSNAFTKLRHYLEDSVFADQLEPILDYFEDCYLGRPNGDKRRKPRYQINELVMNTPEKRMHEETEDTGLFSKIERISEGIFLCIREDGSTVYRKALSYCIFGTEEHHKFVRARIAAYLSAHMEDKWLSNFLDTNDPIEKHIENILIPAKNSLETHKYCQNVDFAAAAKDFGFNVLLFSDIGCSIYSPALDESLIVTQDVSLSSLPIVFTGGNHFEVALNVSAKMEEG
uniref:Uncharacterized protein n=1 Tax=Ditylenchus dipsaci TaxID=166011 RepID=A0A915EUC1_9BILA